MAAPTNRERNVEKHLAKGASSTHGAEPSLDAPGPDSGSARERATVASLAMFGFTE